MKTFRQFLREQKEVHVTAYHGTNVDIDKFVGVVYFSTMKSAAAGYAKGKVNIHKKGSARVYEVELSFKNPKYFEMLQQIGTLEKADIESLKKQGYDGGVYLGTKKEPIDEYVPFYPETIKIKATHAL